MVFSYPKMEIPSCSEKLAEFAVNLSIKDVPDYVVEKTKDTVLDTLGCAIAGRGSGATKSALNVIDQLGGKAESSIIGVKEKTSCSNAAFMNGIMSKCYDFDGGGAGGHSSPIMIPLALALAERDNLSGKDVIEGIVTGVEVMGRVAKALGPEHQVLHGFHTTATSGIFGAAAAAGKMLKLNKDQMTRALGIAGSCVSGTEAYLQDGAWTNCLHCGKPAADGILSAMLAKNGFTGERWILEGIDGILQVYSPRGTTEADMLIDGLGSKWYVGERYAGYKWYSSCGSMHPCLDVFSKIMSENQLNPDDITEVSTWSNFHNYKFNCTPPQRKVAPASIVEGIFSMPFCLGLIAYRKEVTPIQWAEKGILNDTKILSFAKKVNNLVWYDTKTSWYVKINVKTKDGKVYSANSDPDRAYYSSPYTLEKLELKFKKNNYVTSILGEDEVKNIIKLIRKLDKLTDIIDIVDILSKRK